MNMKFFSSHTIANTNTQSINRVFLMPVRSPNPIPIQENQKQSIIEQSPPTPVKKVKWGEPTWFLFHTLSVKIKESAFLRIRAELLNNIYAICINLPCPDCANHAKIYLDNVNFNAIQTKEDFKLLFYRFHNEVNRMKGYPAFSYEGFDEKYSLAITTNIIRNFMGHFSDRNRSIKLLATDLHRSRLCATLKEWFNANIHAFNE